MIATGEIPPTKAAQKAQGKKKQGEAKVRGVRAGKRKRQGGDTAAETTGDEHTPAGTVAGPSTTTSTAPGSSDCHESEAPASNIPPDALITPAAAIDTAGPSTIPKIRLPSLGGLQRELHDLKQIVVRLSENQEHILNENVALRDSVDVLLGLKEKMLVSISALEAEMRGLRSGMEWEKMKQQMAGLRSELKDTKDRLAEFEESSSGEDEEDDDNAVEGKEAVSKNMPRSSMYVPPSELRKSRRAPSPAVQCSSNDRCNRGGSPRSGVHSRAQSQSLAVPLAVT
jgi:hypothetical protein